MAINTTRGDLPALTARVRVTDLAGKTLLQFERSVNAPANRATDAGDLALAPLLADGRMVLVSLELADARGAVLSRNFYWRGRDPAVYRALNALAPAQLDLEAALAAPEGSDRSITVNLANTGTNPALAIKLTVLNTAGGRILPAYYEDNYVSLLPGEQRALTVRVPAGAQPATIGLRGWNAAETRIAIRPR
jgi:hypothetical protein